jgi:hypothetical protein
MSQPSVLQQLWLKWKSLRLPWRRQFLIGALPREALFVREAQLTD